MDLPRRRPGTVAWLNLRAGVGVGVSVSLVAVCSPDPRRRGAALPWSTGWWLALGSSPRCGEVVVVLVDRRALGKRGSAFGGLVGDVVETPLAEFGKRRKKPGG